MENYAVMSLETHLFFARIMKEHALFLEAGFPCKDEAWIKQADCYREQFEELLREVVELAQGRIGGCILKSNELVTEFTIPAEKRTSRLSGVSIDSEISKMTHNLCRSHGQKRESCKKCGSMKQFPNCKWNRVLHDINRRALRLINGLIDFKEKLLKAVENGKVFNANYPLMIKHNLREAKLYRATIEELMRNGGISYRRLGELETFWNQIMMEHALFIRGMLDPSEEELILTADGFASDYKKLLELAKQQDECASDTLAEKSLEETLKYQEFKTAGAEGILGGEIASIILPLLADHVLREANHYIRILECGRTGE